MDVPVVQVPAVIGRRRCGVLLGRAVMAGTRVVVEVGAALVGLEVVACTTVAVGTGVRDEVGCVAGVGEAAG
ncbi:MAG: hypothetical protein JOZ39_05785 [Chloroflexi bacterium]|nr:hypothetical protein [Chloroflexota bacterium]